MISLLKELRKLALTIGLLVLGVCGGPVVGIFMLAVYLFHRETPHPTPKTPPSPAPGRPLLAERLLMSESADEFIKKL